MTTAVHHRFADEPLAGDSAQFPLSGGFSLWNRAATTRYGWTTPAAPSSSPRRNPERRDPRTQPGWHGLTPRIRAIRVFRVHAGKQRVTGSRFSSTTPCSQAPGARNRSPRTRHSQRRQRRQRSAESDASGHGSRRARSCRCSSWPRSSGSRAYAHLGDTPLSVAAWQDAVTTNLDIAEPTWIAVVARGGSHPAVLGPQVYAHTSPVWIDVAGRTVARAVDAAWCLDWLDRLETLAREAPDAASLIVHHPPHGIRFAARPRLFTEPELTSLGLIDQIYSSEELKFF